MFESRTKTIEEQTLVIDDAKFLDVRRTTPGIIDVNYVIHRDATEIHLCISMRREHIDSIAKALCDLTPDQLRAIHAREAETPEEPEPAPAPTPVPKALVPPEPPPEPEQWTPPLAQPQITKLPPEPDKEVSWRERYPNSRQRFTENEIERLLHLVLGWYRRHYRHDNRVGRTPETFRHYIEETLPRQFGISKDTAKRLYTARSYQEFTLRYKSNWINFIKEMTRHKLDRQIPRYILEAWFV